MSLYICKGVCVYKHNVRNVVFLKPNLIDFGKNSKNQNFTLNK